MTRKIALTALAAMLALGLLGIGAGASGELPPPPDAFTDDDGNRHEPNINRAAQLNITAGCDDARYCPQDFMRRDQMASLLVNTYNAATANENPQQAHINELEARVSALEGNPEPIVVGDPY